MSALNTQTKHINVIIMSQKIDNKLIADITEYLKQTTDTYAMILHDKDTLDDGELKKKHLHIVYERSKRIRLSTELNNLSKQFAINVNAISIEKTKDFVGSVQYLIHKKQPSKYQYDISKIITNIDNDELTNYINMENNSISYEYLSEIISISETLEDIIKAVGLVQYRLYRVIIHDIIKSRDMYIKGL